MSIEQAPSYGHEQPDEPVPRRHRRWAVSIQAVVWIDDEPWTCTVVDISPGGARIEAGIAAQVEAQAAAEAEAGLGAPVALDLEGFPSIPAEVRHMAGNALGLMFLQDGTGEMALGRYLVSRRPERPEPRHPVGIEATLVPLREHVRCTVLNISRQGASLAVADAAHLSPGDEVMLSIPEFGDVAATVGRVSEEEVGLTFRTALTGDLPG